MELALFVVGSAVFYAGAMIAMKYWGVFSPGLMVAMIALAFALGAWCEVEALKIERLSAIYVAILGIECIVISLASFLVLGEQVSVREVAGGLVIVAGVAIAAA